MVACGFNFAAAQDASVKQAQLPDVATAESLARAGSVPLSTVLTDLITKGADTSITTGLQGDVGVVRKFAEPMFQDFATADIGGMVVPYIRNSEALRGGAVFPNSRREFLNLDQSVGGFAPIERAVRRGYTPRVIEFDSRFENNVVKLASVPSAAPAAAADNRRIWNGVRIPEPDPFVDAVALTGNGQICSGTLVAPDTVVTAGHCYCGGVMNEAVIGRDIISPVERVPIDKVNSKVLISCDKLSSDISLGDIALVKLTRSVAVPPRKIAPLPMVRDAVSVRAVGFGRTQTGSVGFKYQVNIVIASVQCDGTALTGIPDHRVYGCRPSHELVAASLNRDTCGGDSGGPVYAFGPDASLYLAGLTSRAVDPSGRCGPGGVYVLLSAPPVREWLAENGIAAAAAPQ